jgi:glycosyltransferase involved in cell wall biosynthesis
MSKLNVSVVTPTLRRPAEVRALLENLSQQTILPFELVLVDGAPAGENETQLVVEQVALGLPFEVRYIRNGVGTAIQRNAGIDIAQGEFIAFIDDDIRLAPDFFALILSVFEQDVEKKIGGITGYITNQQLDAATSRRWQWYRRLKLFATYEPGRFDYQTGYTINRYLQPPHDTLKPIDFMGAGCAVWRARAFENGLRFSDFFVGFGVLEDAQMSLRARRNWQLLEHGGAHCQHLHSQTGREDERLVALKTSLNARYLFITIVPQRSLEQELRFWCVQAVQMLIYLSAALRNPGRKTLNGFFGKIEGVFKAFILKPPSTNF